ncbi:hypothetical protein AB0E44_01875 [Micrococcus terreus]|uniref:hypothetical protein n=1 Tax=Micrococcus TaxID=1269 RepID=UPI0033F9FAEA
MGMKKGVASVLAVGALAASGLVGTAAPAAAVENMYIYSGNYHDCQKKTLVAVDKLKRYRAITGLRVSYACQYFFDAKRYETHISYSIRR